MTWWSRFKTAWDHLLFGRVDPLPFALLRIGIGVISLINLASLWPDRYDWFSHTGIVDEVARWNSHRWSSTNVFRLLGTGQLQIDLVLSAAILASLLFALGLFTRWVGPVLFLMLISVHHQNQFILQGADTLMRGLLFPLLFSPCGKILSLDRWIGLRKGETELTSTPNWPLFLIQFQISIMYLATFLWKIKGHQWIDGSAVYTASRLVDFQRFPLPYLFDSLWALRFITWGTLYTEFVLGTLIWLRSTRYFVVALGLFLHLGLEWSMNIPLFEVLSAVALIAFIDGEDIRKLKKLNLRTAVPQNKNG